MVIPGLILAVAFQQMLIARAKDIIDPADFVVAVQAVAYRTHVGAVFAAFAYVIVMDNTVTIPAPTLNPDALMLALSDRYRRRILGLLAKGKPLSVSDVATGIGRKIDGASKHLSVLRDAGAVVSQRNAFGDTRLQLYAVPAQFLTAPGVIDYGFCLLRFGS